MLLSGMWLKGYTQAHGGIDQYYNVGRINPVSFMPVIYFQTGNDWYLEGRYNYEAEGSYSLYLGKTIEKESELSYSISPVIGIVKGSYEGYSAGLNFEAEYKKYVMSSQSQFTLNTKCRNQNFAYSWTDITYQVCESVSAGFSFQHTKVKDNKMITEKGVLLKINAGLWSVPVYLFNPFKTKPYFILGLSYEWKHKK